MVSAPITAHTSTALGRFGTMKPVARYRIAADAESCGEKPPVCTTIRPWTTAFMASVMIIEGIRR